MVKSSKRGGNIIFISVFGEKDILMKMIMRQSTIIGR